MLFLWYSSNFLRSSRTWTRATQIYLKNRQNNKIIVSTQRRETNSANVTLLGQYCFGTAPQYRLLMRLPTTTTPRHQAKPCSRFRQSLPQVDMGEAQRTSMSSSCSAYLRQFPYSIKGLYGGDYDVDMTWNWILVFVPPPRISSLWWWVDDREW